MSSLIGLADSRLNDACPISRIEYSLFPASLFFRHSAAWPELYVSMFSTAEHSAQLQQKVLDFGYYGDKRDNA